MAFITIVFEGYMACPPTMTTLSGAAQTLVEASTPEARARLIPKESAIVRFIHYLLLSVAIRPGGHGPPLFPLTDEQRGWMQRHGAFLPLWSIDRRNRGLARHWCGWLCAIKPNYCYIVRSLSAVSNPSRRSMVVGQTVYAAARVHAAR